MEATERGALEELFESVSDDGTRWAFVIQCDDRWAITRNGKSVAVGTGDRKSIQAGVGKFAALTHGVATSPRDQMVQKQLDLIENQIRTGSTASAAALPSEDGGQ